MSAKKVEKESSDSSLVVVGVGASAGGLEALQLMLSNMPENTNMAFIIAQHLSPNYKSMMVDLLDKDSKIVVSTPQNNETLQPNHAYICPPNHNIELLAHNKVSVVTYSEKRHTPRPSVDTLFESIAQIKGEQAIGIILSGTGSDGSRGIRAIKGENGFGIVQDPGEAKYDGMPNAAIQSGNIDLIIKASEIGEELIHLVNFSHRRIIDDQESNISRNIYNGILELLKVHCKVDFTQYKEKTILRRIERRMAALKLYKVEDYLAHLRSHKDEITLLFNDMLIGVTSFFRDARSFDVLERELSHYLKVKASKDIRIWCAGCSTGEEAYSISIILHQILGDTIDSYNIQLFATDIDNKSIEFARRAIYPESSLVNLPHFIRTKYFTVHGEQYELIKSVKSKVIFSVHDINNDPPFLRLDLITCRNMMIYFSLDLQKIILPMFHYALNPNGLLMLGQSESIGIFQEQYRAVSKSAKIYESVFIGKQLPPSRPSSAKKAGKVVADKSAPVSLLKSSRTKLDEELRALILEQLKQFVLPHAILINENQDIVYSEGANPLLVRPSGLPSNNIYRNFHSQFTVDLRAAMFSLESGGSFAETGFQPININGNDLWAKLILIVIERKAPLGKMTLIFSQIDKPTNIPMLSGESKLTNEAMVLEQQRQLLKTKDQLQDVIEELEASNEDMQSMNEELQSSNEELQSSNEELETTNEELQSTNEELQTAYSELRMAYEEREQQRNELEVLRNNLQRANNLLEDAESAAKMGSWLWDLSTRKMEWSKGCYDLFQLDRDVFSPSFEAFIGLAKDLDRLRLEAHLKALINNSAEQPFMFEATTLEGHTATIAVEAVLSFNELKQVTKVMGTMTDVTQKVMLELQTAMHKDKITYILNSSLNAAFVYDLISQNIEFINTEFQTLFGYSYEEVKEFSGNKFFELFHVSERKKIKSFYRKVATSPPGKGYPLTYQFVVNKTGELIRMHVNHTIFEVDSNTGNASKILVTGFSADV